MLKKYLVFGLLAATFVAPGAAFAKQTQVNALINIDQVISDSGVAKANKTNLIAGSSVNLNVNLDVLQIGQAIASAMNNNQQRGAFTDNLVQTTFFQAGQKYNVLVVNMAQHPQTGNLQDVVFQASARSDDGTIFGIWAFKSGEFTHDGDGGWINWAMYGWYDRDGDGGKHVVFYPAF